MTLDLDSLIAIIVGSLSIGILLGAGVGHAIATSERESKK